MKNALETPSSCQKYSFGSRGSWGIRSQRCGIQRELLQRPWLPELGFDGFAAWTATGSLRRFTPLSRSVAPSSETSEVVTGVMRLFPGTVSNGDKSSRFQMGR